jgi:hypothetical protein
MPLACGIEIPLLLIVLAEQFAEGFGVFLSALLISRAVRQDALGLRLTDALASIGFNGLHRREDLLFRALLRHRCERLIPLPTSDVLQSTIPPPRDVKYLQGSNGPWMNASFLTKNRSNALIR